MGNAIVDWANMIVAQHRLHSMLSLVQSLTEFDV
jgi:hypothetical protein